jgi:hypothetical protein
VTTHYTWSGKASLKKRHKYNGKLLSCETFYVTAVSRIRVELLKNVNLIWLPSWASCGVMSDIIFVDKALLTDFTFLTPLFCVKRLWRLSLSLRKKNFLQTSYSFHCVSRNILIVPNFLNYTLMSEAACPPEVLVNICR